MTNVAFCDIDKNILSAISKEYPNAFTLADYADDLPSPVAVQTNTIRAANTGHSAYNQSTLTYPGGDRFAQSTFCVHYNDSMIRPSFAALGLPALNPGVNHTMIVCEEGTLLLDDLGRKFQVFREGKHIKSEPLPDLAEGDHWHDWVNRCLDGKTKTWSPFSMGVRITEPALLAVKAPRFPATAASSIWLVDRPPESSFHRFQCS